MFPTLDRSRPRHDSGEEFASSYQPLSKPFIPPCSPRNPGIELMPASSYQLPPPIGTFLRSLHFLFLQTGLSSFSQLVGRTPFSHSVGSRHSTKSCNCRFLLAQRPCLFYFVSKSLLFRPFVGLLAGVVAFPLDGPLLCCGSRCVVSVPWYTWFATA